ncbi:MAG: M48 family peptidase, partial [Sphingobacteriia bacterium]|nr:M48 family peptidase [Sphingobacteriia bacterium]
GFEFKKISIRSQRTRWGSCSQAGNLNFNYKLIYLPDKIIDYVIVHELCHLDEFNHSRRFWFLVSEIIPDYRILRRELKEITL